MQHSIPHGLEHSLARVATRKALESYQARFPEYRPTARWVGEDHADISFTVAGKTLKGALDVAASKIDLTLDVPMLFYPFRNAAMKVIQEEIEGWIAKARQGELS